MDMRVRFDQCEDDVLAGTELGQPINVVATAFSREVVGLNHVNKYKRMRKANEQILSRLSCTCTVPELLWHMGELHKKPPAREVKVNGIGAVERGEAMMRAM